ncbi:hypothetical protein BDR06DRAFT_112716 [Suillus hirtellus]|nr:hypothetical protein BDR06DRAFT_112716 [Suillus hirtellus]
MTPYSFAISQIRSKPSWKRCIVSFRSPTLPSATESQAGITPPLVLNGLHDSSKHIFRIWRASCAVIQYPISNACPIGMSCLYCILFVGPSPKVLAGMIIKHTRSDVIKMTWMSSRNRSLMMHRLTAIILLPRRYDNRLEKSQMSTILQGSRNR